MILEGHALADSIIGELAKKSVPKRCLAVIQVGSDPVSGLYVAKKKEIADKLGVCFKHCLHPDEITENNLFDEIEKLNGDTDVGGIIIQMPLPSHIDREAVSEKISPLKDVDGFHCILKRKEFECIPPTVLAIDELLDYYDIPREGKKIAIVGRGFLVGRPLEFYWKSKGFDVEVLEKDSADYLDTIKNSSLVVVATGGGGKFDQSFFSEGAVVVDASTVSENNTFKGDVEVEGWPEEKHLASVPGGVGPVTVAILFRNFYHLNRS